MSISDGERVRALESNAAWLSKTADNTATGKQTLNRVASGAQVTDVQQSINDLNSNVATVQNDIATLQALDTFIYVGNWDASTNTPTLADGDGGSTYGVGALYRVSVDGTQDFGSGPIDFVANDKVVYNNSGVWEKWDVADENAGAAAFQEIPAGAVNGTNTSFGPLSYIPTNTNSILVMIDSLVLRNDQWSLSGMNIILSVAPTLGQEVYVFYLTQGTIAPPPVISGILKTEYRTVSSGEATAKQLTLAHTPAAPSELQVDAYGLGGAQWYGDDFIVTTNILDWSTLGMDTDLMLAAGDKLRIVYVY